MRDVRFWGCDECREAGAVVKDIEGGADQDNDSIFLVQARGDHFEKSPNCEGDVELVPRWLACELVACGIRLANKGVEDKYKIK